MRKLTQAKIERKITTEEDIKSKCLLPRDKQYNTLFINGGYNSQKNTKRIKTFHTNNINTSTTLTTKIETPKTKMSYGEQQKSITTDDDGGGSGTVHEKKINTKKTHRTSKLSSSIDNNNNVRSESGGDNDYEITSCSVTKTTPYILRLEKLIQLGDKSVIYVAPGLSSRVLNDVSQKASHITGSSVKKTLDAKIDIKNSYMKIQSIYNFWPCQLETIKFIEKREMDVFNIGCRGGIVANDMGTGKTGVALGRILTDIKISYQRTNNRFNGVSLIVVEKTLVDNWLSEIENFYPSNTFNVIVLCDNKNKGYSKETIENSCDIVITTYPTIVSAFKEFKRETERIKKRRIEINDDDSSDDEEGGGISSINRTKRYKYASLYELKFNRIFADEAHKFVSRDTVLFKAMRDLESPCKWCFTGTPFRNNLNNFYALLIFIQFPDDNIPGIIKQNARYTKINNNNEENIVNNNYNKDIKKKRSVEINGGGGDDEDTYINMLPGDIKQGITDIEYNEVVIFLRSIMIRKLKNDNEMIVSYNTDNRDQIKDDVVITDGGGGGGIDNDNNTMLPLLDMNLFGGSGANTNHKPYKTIIKSIEFCTPAEKVLYDLYSTLCLTHWKKYKKESLKSSSSSPSKNEGYIINVDDDDDNDDNDDMIEEEEEDDSNIKYKIKNSDNHNTYKIKRKKCDNKDNDIRSIESTKKTFNKVAIYIQKMRQLCLTPIIVKELVLPEGILTRTTDIHQYLNLSKSLKCDRVLKPNEHIFIDKYIQENNDYSGGDDGNNEDEKAAYYELEIKALSYRNKKTIRCDDNSKVAWDPYNKELLGDDNKKSVYMKNYVKIKETKEGGGGGDDDDDAPISETDKKINKHILYRSLPSISTKNRAVADYVFGIPEADCCVLFCPWVGALKVLERDLKGLGIKTSCVTGKDSPSVRTQKIKEFKDPKSNIKIFLLSTKVANVGLNLTKANHVIIYSPWWNPHVEEQAIGRCDRPGQTKTVYVIYFIMKGTMEEYVMHIASEKKNMTRKLYLSSDDQTYNGGGVQQQNSDHSKLSGDMASNLFNKRKHILTETKKSKVQDRTYENNNGEWYILEYTIQNASLTESFFIQ